MKINKIIYILVLIIIFSLTVGFSTLTMTLDIKGSGTVKGEKDVKIINVYEPISHYLAYEAYNPTYSNSVLNTSVRLPNYYSSIEYYGIIKNYSYETIEILKIDKTISNNDVDVQITGLKEKDIIDINASLIFKITIKYKDDVRISDYFKQIDSMIEIYYKEYEGIVGTNLISIINETMPINECVNKGEICPNGTIFNIKVNETDTVNFITISDNGYNINLIAAEVLGSSIWTNENNNYYGPNVLLEKLNNITATWANIPLISNHEWTNSNRSSYKKINVLDGKTTITNRYNNNEMIPGITRALISSNVNNMIVDQNYWTIINGSNYKNAKIINPNGILEDKSVGNSYGIRPIINITK